MVSDSFAGPRPLAPGLPQLHQLTQPMVQGRLGRRRVLPTGSQTLWEPLGLKILGRDVYKRQDVHRLYVTLGQFSIIRLERDTQLLMPVYDYCMPEKECDCGSDCSQEDPCEVFRQVKFPVDEFFPPNSSCSRNCSRSC